MLAKIIACPAAKCSQLYSFLPLIHLLPYFMFVRRYASERAVRTRTCRSVCAFSLFIKRSCDCSDCLYDIHITINFDSIKIDSIIFPSFRNNDLLSYSAHEFAFRTNLINCIDIMASDRFFRYFVFSRGVFSLFRLFAWRFVVFSLGILAGEKTKYFVFAPRHNARRNDERTK